MFEISLAAKAELELRKRQQERRASRDSLREYYQMNPLTYFSDRFGIKPETIDWGRLPEYAERKWDGTPNPMMAILNALVSGKWVGVESATGTGKTHLGALIVYWFLENFENSLVVTTAPKKDQLSLHIWREIGRLYDRFNTGDLTTLKLRMQAGNDDWLAAGFVAGVKANEESTTKAQGFHAEHMLIIIEETPGMPAPVITAFQNTSVGTHNLILAFGNPDHQHDNLHKFCAQGNVEHVRISAYDHPNVVLNNPDYIPGAASMVGINRMLNKYGSSENPFFLSRARGISPAQSQDSLIQLKWCIDAKERELEASGIPALGVDVANSEAGDKAAIAYGVGPVLIEIKDFQCPDSNQLGKRDVANWMKEKSVRAENVGVDGVGVGAGTVNALKEIGHKVKNLIGSESPVKHKGEEDFNNLRSQMYWQMREDLKNGLIKLPEDEELFADLTVPKWSVQNGKIVIESKEKIKERLGRSPNKGDAAIYWNWIRSKRGASKECVVTVY